MSNDEQIVSIELLDKMLKLKCSAEKVTELKQAAEYLDTKMREMRDSGKANGLESIAIMAALNLAFDLLASKKQKEHYLDSMGQRISELQQKIDDALM